ncbi:hypothetical protein QJR30_18240 (plasmid) [Paraclostridium sordellii]|uniref:hypothetical protein n=1 Tax=Paraclostridium sordellii TaxID=1505 RepID=UPI0005E7A080|nr:hypothetical protein [Paeniclostridium sordellii]CEP41133.1 putative phage terminase [[Clostridium] sordellii] [Paeniclostridium sordellii]
MHRLKFLDKSELLVNKIIVYGVTKYFIHLHSFTPKNKVEEHIKSDYVHYDVWIDTKLLTVK